MHEACENQQGNDSPITAGIGIHPQEQRRGEIEQRDHRHEPQGDRHLSTRKVHSGSVQQRAFEAALDAGPKDTELPNVLKQNVGERHQQIREQNELALGPQVRAVAESMSEVLKEQAGHEHEQHGSVLQEGKRELELPEILGPPVEFKQHVGSYHGDDRHPSEPVNVGQESGGGLGCCRPDHLVRRGWIRPLHHPSPRTQPRIIGLPAYPLHDWRHNGKLR